MIRDLADKSSLNSGKRSGVICDGTEALLATPCLATACFYVAGFRVLIKFLPMEQFKNINRVS